MKAKFSKRLMSYIIDSLILSALLTFVSILLPVSKNLNNLQKEWTHTVDSYLNEEISTSQMINEYALIAQDIDKEKVAYSIINAFFILGYFVVYPYATNGQTIGKRMLKIRIKRDDNEHLTMNDLLIRNFIVNGLLCLLLSLAIIYILPRIPYFIITTILGFIQFLLVIISAFMIIYKKDKRGLQDILSHTTVINEEV